MFTLEAVPAITARFLLSCPDQKGLVAQVADLVWRLGGDVVHADQHTDEQVDLFLQRVELRLEGLSEDRDLVRSELGNLASELNMEWRLSFSALRT